MKRFCNTKQCSRFEIEVETSFDETICKNCSGQLIKTDRIWHGQHNTKINSGDPGYTSKINQMNNVSSTTYKQDKTKLSRVDLMEENHNLKEELTRSRKNEVTPEMWVGGGIGVIGYIIYKSINDYGWSAADIVGLFLLAFLPGALFIGHLLNFSKKED